MQNPLHPTPLNNNNPHQNSPSQTQGICYMYIQQTVTAWSCIPLFLLGLFLLIASIRQLLLTKQTYQLNKWVLEIYITIILSLILYLAKIIFAQVTFWIQYNSQMLYQSTGVSQYLFFVNFTGIFCMQTTILLVPVNWFNCICEFIDEYTNKLLPTSNSSLNQLKNCVKLQQICIKILKIYLIIRIFAYIFLVTPYLALHNENYTILSIFIKIMMIWFTIESLATMIILYLGWRSVKENDKLHEILQENDMTIMKNNYQWLIFCCLLRFFTDLFYTVLQYGRITDMQFCRISKYSENQIYQVEDIVFQCLFTFYLSVVIILRIYAIQSKNRQNYQLKKQNQNQKYREKALKIQQNSLQKTTPMIIQLKPPQI